MKQIVQYVFSILVVTISLSIPGVSFAEENAATWLDPDTGLQWTRCPYGANFKEGKCEGDGTRMAWHNAMVTAKNLNAYGHNDWRIPTLEEFRTVFNGADGCTIPAYTPQEAFGRYIGVLNIKTDDNPPITHAQYQNGECLPEFNKEIFNWERIAGYEKSLWTTNISDQDCTHGYCRAWVVWMEKTFQDTEKLAGENFLLVRGGNPDGVFLRTLEVAKVEKSTLDAEIQKQKDAVAASQLAKEAGAKASAQKQAAREAATPILRKNVKAGDKAYVNGMGNVVVVRVKGNFVMVKNTIQEKWVTRAEIGAP